MAENSLVKKLGVKPGQNMLILNAPQDYLHLLEPLPEGAEVKTSAVGTFDFVQAFVYNKADVETYARVAMRALKPGGLLWFTYPKKTSSIKTDITRDIGWEEVIKEGIRPVTQIAVDDTWSALRFRPMSEVKSKSRA
jgi:hypothetical protein